MQRLRHQVNQNHDLENQRLLKEFIQGASNRFHQERLQQDKYYIPVLFLINHFYIVKKTTMYQRKPCYLRFKILQRK